MLVQKLVVIKMAATILVYHVMDLENVPTIHVVVIQVVSVVSLRLVPPIVKLLCLEVPLSVAV